MLNALQILYHWHLVKVRLHSSSTLTKIIWSVTFYFLRKVSPIIDNCTIKIPKFYKKNLHLEKVCAIMFRSVKGLCVFGNILKDTTLERKR